MPIASPYDSVSQHDALVVAIRRVIDAPVRLPPTFQDIEALRAENKQLRLERDVLALNFGARDVPIVIAIDTDGEVVGVGWRTSGTASERQVRLPAYATGLDAVKLGPEGKD